MSQEVDPIAEIRQASRRMIALGRYVYVVRRVKPEELIRQGYVSILATLTAVAQAEAAAQDQQRWTDRLDACTTDDQRKAIEAERTEEANTELLRQLGAALKDPAAAKEALAQCDAYIRASVEAIGVRAEGVAEGLVEPGTAASEVCDVLGSEGKTPAYLRPVSFVDSEPKAGQLSIADLDQQERMVLGHLAMIVSSARREVEPFRGGEGRARRTRSDRA